MKSLLIKICLFILFSLSINVAKAQQSAIDSLKHEFAIAKEDTNKVKLLSWLSGIYLQFSADTAVIYGQKALSLAEKISYENGIVSSEFNLASALGISGNYPLAISHSFNLLSLAKKNKDTVNISVANAYLGDDYYYMGDYATSLKYYRENLRTVELIHLDEFIHFPWSNISRAYLKLNQPDSAILYAKKAYNNIKTWSDTLFVSNVLGDAFAGITKYDSALNQYRLSISSSLRNHTQLERIDGYNGIAQIYKLKNNPDSAVWYLKQILPEKIEKSYPLGLLTATNMLADIYQLQNKPDSALKYLQIALAIKDSLFSREKTNAIQNFAYKEQEKQKEVEAAKLQSQNRLKMYSLLGGLFTVLAIAGLLFRNNRQKQKANTKIEKAYGELKSTQAHLIQSEKMASLGELTAGIAHEIQNPLNFVNNFSEVNKEMIAELKDEIDKGNYNDVKIIADNIEANEDKINYHGKRADAIVKGMLQHSRKSEGPKEPTDINALCDEYLRLSYHGFRAKNKNFNADFKTDFDESIGEINIVPQDIGRVLLNLYNNAFYAVKEKQVADISGYEPIVSVSTKKTGNSVTVSISDNGNGIPKSIVDKIFQPFFTTKPTGQGTGLGLSLSYDIMKAHGGEIKAESKEGEGTIFIIQLPQNSF